MCLWPNFFIIGIEKSGTTSLYEYLKQIPEIFMSPEKEPWYFSPVVRDISCDPYHRITDQKSYLKLFKNVSNEIAIGEASAVYWRDPLAPQLIQKKIPHAKIIISLRDPVDRYFSSYIMRRSAGFTNKSIHENIQKILSNKFTLKSTNLKKESSFLYHDNVKRYLDTFGEKNVLIIIFEEWIKNPRKVIEIILEFLNIDLSEKNFDSMKFEPYNIGRLPESKFTSKILHSRSLINLSRKMLSQSTRKFIEKEIRKYGKTRININKNDKELLIKFLYDDVKKLEKLIGKELPWNNFKD